MCDCEIVNVLNYSEESTRLRLFVCTKGINEWQLLFGLACWEVFTFLQLYSAVLEPGGTCFLTRKGLYSLPDAWQRKLHPALVDGVRCTSWLVESNGFEIGS